MSILDFSINNGSIINETWKNTSNTHNIECFDSLCCSELANLVDIKNILCNTEIVDMDSFNTVRYASNMLMAKTLEFGMNCIHIARKNIKHNKKIRENSRKFNKFIRLTPEIFRCKTENDTLIASTDGLPKNIASVRDLSMSVKIHIPYVKSTLLEPMNTYAMNRVLSILGGDLLDTSIVNINTIKSIINGEVCPVTSIDDIIDILINKGRYDSTLVKDSCCTNYDWQKIGQECEEVEDEAKDVLKLYDKVFSKTSLTIKNNLFKVIDQIQSTSDDFLSNTSIITALQQTLFGVMNYYYIVILASVSIVYKTGVNLSIDKALYDLLNGLYNDYQNEKYTLEPPSVEGL